MALLLDTRPCLFNEINGRAQQVVPYERLLKFLEHITKKSREFHSESQYFQANLQVEMSDASVQLANTMLNIFTCVEQHFVEMVYKKPISEFPIKAYFIKEMPEFDSSLKEMDRLGGTLGHIETENAFLFASNKVPGRMRLSPSQKQMLALFKIIIQMFSCGLLDHIRNFQGVFERIYIRHRLLDDLSYNPDHRLTHPHPQHNAI